MATARTRDSFSKVVESDRSARMVARRASTVASAPETIAARCCRRAELVKFIGFSPGGELGDKVELSKELAHHLTGIIALTQHFQAFDNASDRVFCLCNRRVGVVLAVALETPVMLEKFFPVEIGEALAPRCEVVTGEA